MPTTPSHTITRIWTSLAGFDAFQVSVAFGAPGRAPADFAPVFAAALEACAACGLEPARIVRSRVWARDAGLRQAISDARLIALDGERRAASSSYIAPARMPGGVDGQIDLIAIAAAPAKHVQEYDPPIPPPMYVTVGKLVALSGNTDVSDGFDSQLDRICEKISRSLKAAGADWGNIAAVEAFVSSTLDPVEARRKIAARFPMPVVMTTVEGYSAPEKLVEIETAALLP